MNKIDFEKYSKKLDIIKKHMEDPETIKKCIERAEDLERRGICQRIRCYK